MLYVNDIVDIFSGISVSCKLYADDVKLYASYRSCKVVIQMLQNIFIQIELYLRGTALVTLL